MTDVDFDGTMFYFPDAGEYDIQHVAPVKLVRNVWEPFSGNNYTLQRWIFNQQYSVEETPTVATSTRNLYSEDAVVRTVKHVHDYRSGTMFNTNIDLHPNPNQALFWMSLKLIFPVVDLHTVDLMVTWKLAEHFSDPIRYLSSIHQKFTLFGNVDHFSDPRKVIDLHLDSL